MAPAQVVEPKDLPPELMASDVALTPAVAAAVAPRYGGTCHTSVTHVWHVYVRMPSHHVYTLRKRGGACHTCVTHVWHVYVRMPHTCVHAAQVWMHMSHN